MPMIRSGNDVALIFSMSTGEATLREVRGVGPGRVVGGTDAAVVTGAPFVVAAGLVVGVAATAASPAETVVIGVAVGMSACVGKTPSHPSVATAAAVAA